MFPSRFFPPPCRAGGDPAEGRISESADRPDVLRQTGNPSVSSSPASSSSRDCRVKGRDGGFKRADLDPAGSSGRLFQEESERVYRSDEPKQFELLFEDFQSKVQPQPESASAAFHMKHPASSDRIFRPRQRFRSGGVRTQSLAECVELHFHSAPTTKYSIILIILIQLSKLSNFI